MMSNLFFFQVQYSTGQEARAPNKRIPMANNIAKELYIVEHTTISHALYLLTVFDHTNHTQTDDFKKQMHKNCSTERNFQKIVKNANE